jgi:DNA (cytosine-5)-methyltransferase 1
MNDSSKNIFLSDGQSAATSGKLNHGSLFSGIGGFDLAAEWMGWENVFHCEWNEFGQRILKYYWPKAISYGDITKTDFSIHRGKIDILTGGFPCQPYSVAGKRKGKEDERHLWPEMLRAIREIAPKYVVGENVSGLLSWNGGLVFNEVQVDLENEGYEAQPCILPACAVNAPHRRDRVWFVANSVSKRYNRNEQAKRNNLAGEQSKNTQQARNERTSEVSRFGIEQPIANTNSDRLQRGENGREPKERQKPINEQFEGCDKFYRQDWEKFPTQSPICGGNDGLPSDLDDITFPKWRQKSIKAYGNAIVPQVAYQIFKALMITESKAREEKNIITGDMHEPLTRTEP